MGYNTPPIPICQSQPSDRLSDITHTQTTPTNRNPRRQRLPRRKIRRQYTHARHKQTPRPQANTKRLRQHNLPVLARDTRHHHAEYNEERADGYKVTEITGVEERPREARDEE